MCYGSPTVIVLFPLLIAICRIKQFVLEVDESPLGDSSQWRTRGSSPVYNSYNTPTVLSSDIPASYSRLITSMGKITKREQLPHHSHMPTSPPHLENCSSNFLPNKAIAIKFPRTESQLSSTAEPFLFQIHSYFSHISRHQIANNRDTIFISRSRTQAIRARIARFLETGCTRQCLCPHSGHRSRERENHKYLDEIKSVHVPPFGSDLAIDNSVKMSCYVAIRLVQLRNPLNWFSFACTELPVSFSCSQTEI